MSPKVRVMIVDDEARHLDLMISLFKDSDIAAEPFTSGEEALAALQDGHQYHLVLTDVVMPGMTGIELAKSIRATHPDLPVVLITGHDGAVNAAEGSGRVALIKPFTHQTVNSVLIEHLGVGI
jgi:DNA-binding NtrC family response regulator